jgi:hypothetical protein|tara:strand:+ start:1136 stop:1384 length:249 start_codon:yes stop_codon:yes gene_type:complete
MRKVKEDWSTRTITTPDGITISFFNNKLHNWNGPAVKYKDGSKRKAEYYLYGIQRTKDDWIEFRRDRSGVPPDKNPQVQSRF